MFEKCEKYDNCPLCRAVFDYHIQAPWIMLYCKGGQSAKCARFNYLEKVGTKPPIFLFPDGTEATGERREQLEQWVKDHG